MCTLVRSITAALLTLSLAACTENVPAPGPDLGPNADLPRRVDRGPHDASAPEGSVPDASAVCGNGSCQAAEHCASCPADCGACGPLMLTADAEADSYVDAAQPSANYGTATTLYTDQAPDQQALFRFVVQGVVGTVTRARLRLRVQNGSSDGPAVYVTTDPWDEGTVNWTNRPALPGAPVADLAAVAVGWIEIDVTSAVTGDGTYAFALAPTSSDGVDFASRESADKPQLLVDCSGGKPPAPDAGPPTGDGGPPAATFSFFALGDTRTNPNYAQTNFQSLSQLDPHAVMLFNSGDITANGNLTQWQTHEQAVSLGSGGKIRMDLTTFTPGYIRYFGLLGNHDVSDASWRTNWNNFLSGQASLGHNGSDGIWFSFVYKNALFVVLDSEHPSAVQTSWLQSTLAQAATNPAIVWRFAFFHKPIYPCNYKTPFAGGVPWAREFEKHGVDLVFVGHAHLYERTCPLVGGKCAAAGQGGVRYITSGGGGAPTTGLQPSKKATVGTDSYDCSEILTAGKSNWMHYCHLRVEGRKLTYRCYPHDQTANPEDTLVLTK